MSRLADNGDFYRVVFSNHGRDSYLNHLPLEVIPKLYEALKKFDTLCRDPSNQLKYKLQRGE